MTDPPKRTRDAGRTRALILGVAKQQFAQRGYRPTTVKGVADEAGVSPNLITRYFGGKDGLFLAASQTEIASDRVYDGPLDGFGARLARSVVRRWTDQRADDPLLVLHRASGERPDAAEALSRFLDEQSLTRVRRYLESCGIHPAEARDRAAAIDALVLGVSTRQRVLRQDLDDAEDLERWLGAALHRLAAG